MLRKDHAMILTDAGTKIHLGWDYKIPYYIDPINGVDVSISTSQGVNQVGVTVDQQSVGGVYREITGDFLAGDAAATTFLNALPYNTAGTLYLFDKYFARFVVSKTPYVTGYNGILHFSLMILCDKPYWLSLTASEYQLGGYTAAFSFPVNYDEPHTFGVKNDAWVNIANTGSLPVPYTARFVATAPVQNPVLLNVLTGEYLKLLTTLESGDVIDLYRTNSGKVAVTCTRDGIASNIFSVLDEGSTLFDLASGDNVLRMSADTNASELQASLSFYPMFSGILPDLLGGG